VSIFGILSFSASTRAAMQKASVKKSKAFRAAARKKVHAKFDRKSEWKIDMCVLHRVHNSYYGHQLQQQQHAVGAFCVLSLHVHATGC
jgi:metal-responsive CopG/Arc/MetJ family transcriptional regulator